MTATFFLHARFLQARWLVCISLVWLSALFHAESAHAESAQYLVEIDAAPYLKTLLEKHLDLIKWRQNARMTPAEWERLTSTSPEQIKALLATEGFFSPNINTSVTHTTTNPNNVSHTAKLVVEEGSPTYITDVNIQFSGDITHTTDKNAPSPSTLKAAWPLKVGMQFRQADWTQAKRLLLTKLLVSAYPNATITNSQATIAPDSHSARLQIEVDSANVVYFGDLDIEGLTRYPESIVRNLNPIKVGRVYQQDQLLLFQTRLQESSYFKNVEVTANTQATNPKIPEPSSSEAPTTQAQTTETLTKESNATKPQSADSTQARIKVTVEENPAVKMTTGLGYSTNTGARSQVTVEHLNLFNRSWRSSTSLRLEQRLQALSGSIRFPTTPNGYRDSANATVNHSLIEGQSITTTDAGIKRAWGNRKREQYVGASFINEHINLDGAESSDNYAATLNYGITLRRTDNDLNPTRGYLFNAQLAGAPVAALSNGSFLQTYVKLQTYYPITQSTQLITRGELGMVNGKNSAPAAFLFRAGGDQSVRGYAYQSLGITEGDATVGARYLLTGSVEVVQWLTDSWGAAVFVDAGNAANTWKSLNPVYGYGLGARWKSPVGPIGADIAYGQETDDYRMHFNIGVVF